MCEIIVDVIFSPLLNKFERMIFMKKLLVLSMVTAAVAVSSLSVFAASTDTSTSANSIDTIISKVTGFESAEIAVARANGIGYGKLIPASILAKKLNITLEEAVALKEDDKTYAQTAQDNGITLDEYKQDILEKRSEFVDEKVSNGYITAEQGDVIKERISDNIENCDGTGSGQNGSNGGCGMRGSGNGARGNGRGNGLGRGNGIGGGRGNCGTGGCSGL